MYTHQGTPENSLAPKVHSANAKSCREMLKESIHHLATGFDVRDMHMAAAESPACPLRRLVRRAVSVLTSLQNCRLPVGNLKPILARTHKFGLKS